jgi:hypothetical protein
MELLVSLCIPADPDLAAVAGVTPVDFSKVPRTEVARMAGNSMNLVAVGSILLATLVGVEFAP